MLALPISRAVFFVDVGYLTVTVGRSVKALSAGTGGFDDLVNIGIDETYPLNNPTL